MAKSAKGGDKPAKKEKKEKDPNAPKRPITAYFVFTNEKRDEVKAANPGVKVTEIAKLLGEEWKKLSDAEKKPYNDKAAKDKQRYETEKAAYEGGATKAKSPAKKSKKAKEEEEEEEEEDDE